MFCSRSRNNRRAQAKQHSKDYMHIRKAKISDLPVLMHIFECAKGIMRASGNLHQWGYGYPSEDVVRCDIEQGVCYVATENDSAEIAGVMSFIPGPDPTYAVVYDGAWLNENNYSVIHRIAVAKPGKGVAKFFLDWAFRQSGTVRIDTHRDNVIMHHILKNYGFVFCGIIHLANGDPRDAYQLTLCESV